MTETFSVPLSEGSGDCSIVSSALTALSEQNAQIWQAEVFLGKNQIRSSPVNLTAVGTAVSSSLSFGLDADKLQMQPCTGPPACETMFEVSKRLLRVINGANVELNLYAFHAVGIIVLAVHQKSYAHMSTEILILFDLLYGRNRTLGMLFI